MLGTPSAEANIIVVDVSSFSGPNAGVPVNGVETLTIAAANGNSIDLNFHNAPGTADYDSIGIDFHGSATGGIIAYGDFTHSGTYPKAATPTAFSAATSIDARAFANVDGNTFGSGGVFREFYGIAYVSPDITNKYLAFRTNTDGTGSVPNYGWINVSWNSSTLEYLILGAAYESVAGVAIKAGDTGTAAVPEIDPSSLASVMALVMGSGAMLERRRRNRVAKVAESA